MKKILTRNIGIGLLLLVVFNIVLFMISLPFGFEDSGTAPTLPAAVLLAVIMGFIVWLILKYWIKSSSSKEAWSYSLSWAGIVFFLILLITIPNGTTKTFFGSLYDWLVFLAMGAAPVLLKKRLNEF